jgi:hypothetical protein
LARLAPWRQRLRSQNRPRAEFIFNVTFEPTTKEPGDDIAAGRLEQEFE